MSNSRETTGKVERYRAYLNSGELMVAPGIYDGYSARLVEQAGFACAATSGAAISNALLGIDDIGVMGLRENVEHCRHLARAVSIPITCDADTGYGNPMNVHYTVQMFEEAGVAGINIEDQVAPKRCGHMPGKEVVPLAEMVKKIEAACLARRNDAFVICARTDALALEGIDGAVARIRAYAAAGADMIFPDAVRREEDIARIVEAAGVPVTINMGFGIRARPTTPLIPLPRLKALGVRRVSLPRMLPGAAIRGMANALAVMKQVIETGEPVDRPEMVAGIDEITALMGYAEMRALEARLLTTDALDAKYAANDVPDPTPLAPSSART
ncbi:isocitrate lyase/PEP mutase family protein [Rhodoplanes sp. TEM]|uniref:Isocitrate lyase/PEP mutase family protein n=1 Tax=Rhodoplanes tepidamans TaxID=200616 RepID=A0ABT5J979_RHOTP|nr:MULTISPECIES: isocitrate lyase/PEP mutase family protein [Rhodoplanes]MDC7785615.1 isocitrate lyase/PEP mutase family protein [Rhodoplanes tepidamans]MDC7985716.1 isocitrate lyase/PEP mutase family protein [Rhodoplanes sp. TEM]MDQ0354819.1 2-methylisocitrate lyase-like PEP mutase family enzyme [Rhodoplanes tepidamans]